MNLKELAPDSHTKAMEDHSDAEYAFEGSDGEMTIYAVGHFTIEELQFKLRLLVEATKLHADKQISLPL